MTDEDKWIVGFFIALFAVIAGIVLYCAIPIEEKVVVNELSWHWTVQLYEYRKCDESAWGRLEYDYPDGREHLWSVNDGGYDSPWKDHNRDRNEAVPQGAYNLVEKVEWYDDRRVSDGEDGYYYEDVYRYRYYYSINRWVESSILTSGGFDKSPYEPECQYPFGVENPQLGDIIRGGGHEEVYHATGVVKKTGEAKTYEISYSQWSDLNAGDTIELKRSRFGNKVKEMVICQ